jgi:hypothetical protein
MDFESYEKDKRERLEKTTDANGFKDQKKNEQNLEKYIINKYDIKFDQEDFEFFNY